MNAMRPDQIIEEMDRQRRKDLRDEIFAVIMLVIAPIVFIVMIITSILG